MSRAIFSSDRLQRWLFCKQACLVSEWRMKTKWRLLFVGAALFVIIVSYKILEPELFGTQRQPYVWDKEPFEADDKQVKKLAAEQSNDDSPELPADHHRNAFYIAPEEDRRAIDLKPVAVFVGGVKQEKKDGNYSIDEVIKSMIDRYSPNYAYYISESPWKIAASWVKPRQIHPENAQELGAILQAMSHNKITQADVSKRGTQLKLSLLLDNAQRVLFKPAWYPRDYIVTGTPYAGRDRHNAEIAAFHLGRILELRRTPLAIGRTVDIHKEIIPVATDTLLNTFFEKDGESCFYGKCLYCKGPEDGVCAANGVMEGTIVLWLPSTYKMVLRKHPWSRTYKDNVPAKWERDNDYCDKVKKLSLFSSGPHLLDIIDTCVFDYLIGNADRHHYETFDNEKDSILIILDNGKSFGNPHVDEVTILAPLYQCCQIRASLWQRLLALQDGVLSKVLAGVVSHDPIAPILTQDHLDAMDRRLKTILDQIQICMDKVGIHAIVMDQIDGSR